MLSHMQPRQEDLELKVVGHIGLAHYIGAVDKRGNVYDARVLIGAPRSASKRYFRLPVGAKVPSTVQGELWGAIDARSMARPGKRRRSHDGDLVPPRQWVVSRITSIYTDEDGYRLCRVSWQDFPVCTTEPLHLIEEMAPGKVRAYYRDEVRRMVDVD